MFKSSINPIGNDASGRVARPSPQKMLSNKKKMGSQISLAPMEEEKSYMDNDTKLASKASNHGTFSEKDTKVAANTKKGNDAKTRALVGNCPMNHESNISNVDIPEKRQSSIAGCFGSSGMAASLTGASRAQQRMPKSDKPNNVKYDDVK